ncbi:MAG: hypothetical protein K2N87_14950 [Eubacterium sp.]|nr:hypothetical protein [Eubacterium sp.]
MNENLVKKTEEWMQLERKTLAQRKVAEEFYYNNLMTLIEADYIERNKASIGEKAKYFITSVGTSYEPIVLNIRFLTGYGNFIPFFYRDCKFNCVLSEIGM